MSLRALVGWVLWAGCTVWGVAPAATPPPASADPPPFSSQAAHAPIEEVLEAVDNGYRFDAYIVRWHGARVLVSAPAL